MDTRDDFPDDGGEALSALRRTLWQLAVVGIAAAYLVERIAPEAQAVVMWCALAPVCALATHFRQAIAERLRHAFHVDEPAGVLVDATRNRGARARRSSLRPRRKAAMALRRGPTMSRAGTR